MGLLVVTQFLLVGSVSVAASAASSSAFYFNDATTAANNVLTNSGTLTSASNTATVASVGDVTITTFTNSGTIRNTGSGPAISLTSIGTVGGGFTLTNSGTITGDISLTGGGDTLNVSGNSSTITGDIAFNGGTDTMNVSGTFTTGGAISGLEALKVDGGSGNGIELQVDHAITGNPTVNITSGDTLDLNEDLTTTNALTMGGTVDIASLKTLTVGSVTGNAAGANSVLISNITGDTSASQLVVSGGGGVDFSNTDFQFRVFGNLTDGVSFTIVDDNAAPVTGTVVDNSALYDYAIALTGTDDISVTVTKVGTMNSLATNGDAKAIGAALDSLSFDATGDLSTIIGELSALNTTQLNTALESLTPGTDTAVGLAGARVQAQSLGTVSNRLAMLRGAEGTGVATGDGSRHVWGQFFGDITDQDQKDNKPGFDARTWGLAFGVDSDNVVEGANVGVAVSYADTNVDSDSGNNADTDVDSYSVSAYGSKDLMDGMWVNGMATFGVNNYEGTRTVNVGGFGRTASADYDGWQFGLKAEVGKDIARDGGNMTLTPVGSIEWSHLNMDSYTETGAGGANLTVDTENVDTITLGAGAEWAWNKEDMKPVLRAKLTYDVGDVNAESTSTFSGGGSAFKTEGLELGRLAAQVGAGVTFYQGDSMELMLNYDAEIRDESFGHHGLVNARWAW